MDLPLFISFDTTALPGADFILCTNQPYFVAKVWKFYNNEKMQHFEANYNDWNIITVPGYRVLLTYEINMMRILYPPKNWVKETLLEMGTFYLTEKIQPNAEVFIKFAI